MAPFLLENVWIIFCFKSKVNLYILFISIQGAINTNNYINNFWKFCIRTVLINIWKSVKSASWYEISLNKNILFDRLQFEDIWKLSFGAL